MSVKKKIEEHLKKRPEYAISEQYYDNQALARAAAFGRDRAVQQQEENIEQESANAIGMAGQYSNSASGILNTLSSITNSKNQALRNLAIDESAIQRTKMQDLYGANVGLAEEEDKAFEYNVNMPYQKKLEMLQEKKRRRQQLTDTAIGWGTGVAGLSTVFGGGGAGGATGLAPTEQNAPTGDNVTGVGASNAPAGEGYYKNYSGGKGGGGGGGAMGIIGSIFSDERLKKNPHPTKYGLNEILDIKVVEYEYITDPSPQRHVGVMAQNVLDLIPEAVDQSNKFMRVNYNEIVPVLIKAVQEQNQIIEALKLEVSQLKQSA